MTQWLSLCYLRNSNSYYSPPQRKFPFLLRMDSATTRRCTVYPVLNLFIHGITPPLIAVATITAPHPPTVPLEGS